MRVIALSIKEQEKEKMKQEKEEEEISEIEEVEQEVVTEVEKISEELKVTKQVEVVKGRIQFVFPDWIDYPWMYVKPRNADLYRSWRQNWGNLLFKWVSFHIKHVISVDDLLSTDPYSKLPVEYLKEIMNYLVEKGFAKWLDNNRLRIYWKSLEELADYLYNWALNTGTIYFTPYDLLQEGPDVIKNLPTEDLLQVINILINNGKAKWMDKSKRAIRILLPKSKEK